MKKAVLFLILSMGAVVTFGQTSSHDRDSVAQTAKFQTQVRMASVKAANDILADTSQAERVRQYGQLIISSPVGGEWLSAMSYGVMSNPAINAWSVDGDIQFTVNSLFVKYAYAYYREKQR